MFKRFHCFLCSCEAAVVENGVNEVGGSSVAVAPTNSAPSVDTPTDNGPADSASSDGEPVNPVPRRQRRRHTPRSEQPHRDSSQDDKPAAIRKPPRAKSTPVISTKEKENQRPSSRLDWSERQMEVKRTTNDVSAQFKLSAHGSNKYTLLL